MTPDAQRAAYYARNDRAEAEFLAHARAETGHGCPEEKTAKQKRARETLLAQSRAIADRLEEARKIGYAGALGELGRWWIHSRKMQEIPQFRRICLLPYVAAMVRAQKLAALEFFLERNPFARFWTFTTGGRCGIEDIRDRCRYLHRKLSKLSAFLRERYGVELVFRSTEFGTVGTSKGGGRVEFDPTGKPLFHVHAHVVVNSLVGFIKPAKWAEMIDAVRDFWVHHWDAGTLIKNARECCKYVTKPGDILKLTAEQLGMMHEAVFRMKLCQPMGSLKEEIRARKDKSNPKVLRRYRKNDGSGGFEWREVGNQNEHVPQTAEERAFCDEMADCEAFDAEHRTAMRVEVEPAPDAVETRSTWCFPDGSTEHQMTRGERGFWVGTEVRQPDRSKGYSRVLARLSPSVGPSGRKEPSVIVAFTHFDQKATESHPLVARLWAETVQQWEAAGGDRLIAQGANPRSAQREDDGGAAAAIRLHTVTPTVRAQPRYSPGYSQPAAPPGPMPPFLS